MTGRSHMAIGTTTAVAGTAITSCGTATTAIVVACAMGTAKLPDIDQRIGLRHRGVTHTLIACVLVALVTALALSIDARTAVYASAAMVGVLIGYGTHIAADACTPHGVPVLAPFCRRDLHLLPRPLRVVTGSWQEMLIVTLLVGATIFLAYRVHYA